MGTDGVAVRASVWPVIALAFALAAAVTAVVLMQFFGLASLIGLAAAGYGLGAVVSVVFASLYRASKSARRGPTFRENPALDRIVTILLVTSVVAGIACAYFLATEVARR